MSKKIKDEQKKFLGETLNQYDKALDEAINQLDKKNREQNHKISSLTNSFDNEYLEKDVEGNMTDLENSKNGMVIINEIQGSTEVNYCKDGEKELILNGDIDTQGKSFVTITEGVDGGLVDVSLEGNTEINLSKTKDPVLVTREFDDINCNVGKLQYTIDDVTTINDEPGKVDIDRIVGDTMVNHAVNGSEELILNAHINESGDNSITLNGVTSDGGKVDVALEGNTLVNVSKTKDSTAITKSYTVENSGNHIALQGEYDGSCRPVITGNTLVNLTSTDSVTINITTVSRYITLLRDLPAGTYTAIFNLSTNTLDGKVKVACKYDSEIYYPGGIDVGKTGLIKYVFTPTDTINAMRFYTDTSTSGEAIIENLILLEGDYTNKPIPGYFEGLQSSFEDKVVTQEMVDNGEELAENLGKYKVDYVVTGKNKAKNPLYLEDIQYNSCVKLIGNLKPNTTYTLSLIVPEGQFFVADYTKTFTERKGILGDGTRKSLVVTTKNDIILDSLGRTFIFFNETNYSSDGTASNLQIEEGSTATTYEPYKEYTKTLYLNSPLLEGDTIEEKDGNIYHVHRYKEVVLDGSDDENWNLGITSLDTTIFTQYYLPGLKSIKCTNVLPLAYVWDTDTEGVNWNAGYHALHLRLNKSRLSTLDEQGIRQWLSQNPMSVVYELKTPTYELIEQSNLTIPSYANGHLDLASAVPIEKVEFLPFNEELTYLYPATSYTLQFVSDKAISVDIALGGTQLLAQDIVQGLNRISITTLETLANNKLIIDGVGAKISNVVVTDTDRGFGYFEGMKSVGECEDLEVVSMKQGLPLTSFNNVLVAKPMWKIPYNDFISYAQYFNEVGGYSDCKNKYDFYYVGTSSIWIFLGTFDNYEAYIEFNSHIKSNKQQLNHEPLRAVGDIKDKYVLIDGKWYIERNCMKFTFNGSEPYWSAKGYGGHETRNTFEIYIDPRIHNKSGVLKSICDRYMVEEVEDIPTKDNSYRIVNDIGLNNKTYFLFTPSTSIIPYRDLDAWKEWLSENPITIIVECSPTYEQIDYNPLEVYSNITHISTNSAIPTNITIKNHGYNMVALKENTQYTLYVNKNTTNTLTYRLGDYIEINSPSKFTFTTPETLTDKTLRIDGKGVKVKDLMLIEGTPTNDSIGYFDGLKSSYECEQVIDENDMNYGKYKVDIKVVGKNLFDMSKIILNKYQNSNASTGNYRIVDNPSYKVSGFIRVKPNTSYFKTEGDIGVYYTLNKTPIKGTRIERGSKFTTPYNCHYVVFTFNIEEDVSNWQLEEGTQPTEYEPYFESKQTIYLNSPLLKGDEIVWKDNKIQHYHKMNKVVLDGSDDEIINLNADRGNLIEFIVSEPSIPNRTGVKYVATTLPNVEGLVEKIVCGYQVVYIQLQKARLQSADVSGFKQWLQTNPITVVHELKTPYYEEISDYPLKLNVIANSSLSTESTIQVTNISFNIYEETLPYLYPNTKYYITFNVDVDRNNIIINLGGNHVVFDCKVGFNKVEIITPNDTTNLLTFSGTGVNIDHVKVTQQDIDEYFEGMKSVGECENNTLEIVCKNNDNSKSNIQTLTHEPLRAVGDIKDKYVLIDGKWYIERNCNEVVFDGSDDENWNALSDLDLEKTKIFRFRISSPDYSNHYCDKLQTYSGMSLSSRDIEGIYVYNSSLRIRINKSKLLTQNVAGFKQWLQQNPTTVVYQLKAPTYEPINYNPFAVYSDITHISNNSLIPSNMVIKNHGYNTILKPSTKYTVALNKPNGTISAKLGGSAKVDSTNSIFTITTPSTLNDNVLRLSGSGNVKDIMILEGDKTVNTPSYFEGIESVFEQEYDTEKGKYRVTARVEGNGKESSIIFYINEPLRGTDTAKDKVFIQDGKVVVERNCSSSITFDGSEEENLDKANTDFDSVNNISFTFNTVNNISPSWTNPKAILSSSLPNVGNKVWKGRQEGITSNSTIILICLNRAKLQTQDLNGFKQWLQQNPVTVVYQLAKPVYEEADCDLSKLVLENYENSSLIFESNIPVSANIRYSGEVPVVTQAKTLSSQVDNTTLDINENIIPYMCDIDYRIVELQLMNGDTQGEGIELLGIGDIEILGNKNVLFNNREDKKHNFSYDMLKRDILSQRYSKEEYRYRLDRYLLADKISNEEYKELEGLLNNGE